jgi:hypothetical protein
MEGAAGVVSLPTWMQLGCTFIVLMFAAGSGIWSYMQSRHSGSKSDLETVELLRRLAQSNEAIENSRTLSSNKDVIALLQRTAESSEELLELIKAQRDDARFTQRVEERVKEEVARELAERAQRERHRSVDYKESGTQ